jgi:hypothetical protein
MSLSDATSPYLLSHKDNPIRWRLWGPEALAEAKARVDRAGVLRQPMYVAYGAAGPAAAPVAGGAAALARVAQVQVDLQRWLHRLLHDLSAPPWELQDVQAVTGHAGSEVKLPIEPLKSPLRNWVSAAS